MDERFRKVSSITPAEIVPPILLRRRLSAPETIMRKHKLAQQRSSSQESNRSQNSEGTQSCPLDVGSESNLARRKDMDIRKSTLIKQFWESSRVLPFPRTYSEWQYSLGKMKLNSNHTTPEHLRYSRKNIFDTSPIHKRVSSKIDSSLKQTNKSVYSSETSGKTKLSDDTYAVYSSNFSDVTVTDSNRTLEETTTTPTIHSDSAYTNSFTTTDPPASSDNQISDGPIKYQFILRENSTDSKKSFEFIPKPSNESSTQTGETTNLNVISNVQLSQSTLNLIFNQVMQDVVHNKVATPEPVQPKIINVQTMPTFSITPTPTQTKQNDSKLISEVDAGSPYKIKETPLVPRLSALPRTTSMEVNISSNDSFDKESSDTNSLVDSLEDTALPKDGKCYDDKLVRGELSLLPDNSDNVQVITPKKSSVFYIPIKNDETVLKDGVSTLLPMKLKERLLKRQVKREEKRKEAQMRSFQTQDIENGNHVHPYFESSPEPSAKAKPKKKKSTATTPTLPSIENKSKTPNKHKPESKTKSSFWLPKTIRTPSQSIKHEPTSSKKPHHKPETKKVEILEIMEIVEPTKPPPKPKSRIPILVQPQKLPKLAKPKPTFLDFELTQGDPKLDQLIANILIDTLHREDKTFADAAEMTDNNPRLIEQAAELLTQQVLENNNFETDARAAAGPQDGANVPKGWITFYMLQKNNSPDSTSDEGPKAVTKSSRKYKSSETLRDSDYKSEECSTDSEKRSRRRRVVGKPGAWTVTVSGTSSGQQGPDLEMRLKFPKVTQRGALRNEVVRHETASTLPPLASRKKRHNETGMTLNEMCSNRRATEINKSKQYLKNCDSSTQTLKLEPRPTKTSQRRCMLNRPNPHKHFHEIPMDSTDRSFQDIMDSLPDILAVNGNAMARDNKPTLPKMSERDLKRILSHFNKTHNL